MLLKIMKFGLFTLIFLLGITGAYAKSSKEKPVLVQNAELEEKYKKITAENIELTDRNLDLIKQNQNAQKANELLLRALETSNSSVNAIMDGFVKIEAIRTLKDLPFYKRQNGQTTLEKIAK